VNAGPVVVIGNFDGVHRGHVALLRAARSAEPAAPLVAVTFWPHPMSVVRPDQAPPLLTDGIQPSSSTLIRHAVLEGDFGRVRELSDQTFRFSGVVVRGDQRGRELGFPTANVAVEPGMAVPADGVYAGWVTRLDGPSPRWPAAISVGSNPTFEGVQRRIEAYVLDRDDLELYGVEIAIDFYARLRGQVKYAGLGPLIEQMHHDVEDVRHLLQAS